MARDYLPVNGLGPAPMRRRLALPLTNKTYHTRRDEYSDIYIIRVARHNVLLLPTNNAVPVH